MDAAETIEGVAVHCGMCVLRLVLRELRLVLRELKRALRVGLVLPCEKTQAMVLMCSAENSQWSVPVVATAPVVATVSVVETVRVVATVAMVVTVSAVVVVMTIRCSF